MLSGFCYIFAKFLLNPAVLERAMLCKREIRLEKLQILVQDSEFPIKTNLSSCWKNCWCPNGPCHSGVGTSARSPNVSPVVREQVPPIQLVPVTFSLFLPACPHPSVHLVPFEAGGIHQRPSPLRLPSPGVRCRRTFSCIPRRSATWNRALRESS